ncbi:MAG TPA: hypothetical protein VLZ83_12475 [Edaphocola sp.]|nr:hypothetical protein [Edaphocola sp.]
MIYNYLFYKGYQLAKKSKNWEDAPVFFATIVVGMCAILNFATLLFLFEGFSGSYFQFEKGISFVNKFKYISGALLAFLIWFFYSYKGRGLKIVQKHTLIENEKGRILNPLLVVMLAYFISLALIAISSMYMHRKGIFA